MVFIANILKCPPVYLPSNYSLGGLAIYKDAIQCGKKKEGERKKRMERRKKMSQN